MFLVCLIQGAGCDHILDSDTRRDECGVCGGDNSSCKTVTGNYNKQQNGKTWYRECQKHQNKLHPFSICCIFKGNFIAINHKKQSEPPN